MSTLASQRTFKAVWSLLHHPLRHPLGHAPLNLLRAFSNQAGILQTPCSGYDILAQRFSSYPNPVNLYALPSWKKTAHPGGYVDIHDPGEISDLKVNNYDVLITDITENTLRTEISNVFGIDYLAKATENDAKRKIDIVSGYLYGEARRAMVPCVVHNGENDEGYWVHFLVDTGSPATFLSKKACDAIGLRTDGPTSATIAGYTQVVRMSPVDSHFADVNTLGMDYCDTYKFNAMFLGNGRAKYYFMDRWAGAKALKA
ncbi:uncharacterized protein Z518_07043 [Rhinocladiella mackenziei CBS 650.93]|uniref:Uncharacterized protein n=1 Tax=Rhinocladiella mackenziei CBS 650.93 TaxID=1442369 RepID=A0A0D2J3G9_9EURO|nr:uncharacterized protein Z518_07043 [Rhinocladiella mackenziei CBS 650.93]KIX03490.1 hypothetical protein Z518_07043 [Rhinocladiella mackenziei CBS 650.93]